MNREIASLSPRYRIRLIANGTDRSIERRELLLRTASFERCYNVERLLRRPRDNSRKVRYARARARTHTGEYLRVSAQLIMYTGSQFTNHETFRRGGTIYPRRA